MTIHRMLLLRTGLLAATLLLAACNTDDWDTSSPGIVPGGWIGGQLSPSDIGDFFEKAAASTARAGARQAAEHAVTDSYGPGARDGGSLILARQPTSSPAAGSGCIF